MRILYLNPSGQLGGAETSLLELLASVRAIQPSWELWLALGEGGPLVAKAQSLGVQVTVVPYPPSLARLGDAGRHPLATLWSLAQVAWGTSRYARRLAATCRRLKPDIIHTNGFKMHVLGVWARPSHASVIWHIHDYVRSRRIMKRLLLLCASGCNAAIANSESTATDMRALLPKLNVVRIYNAIDLDRFSPVGDKLDLDAISGLSPAPENVVRIGLVGTFARWKGHRIFLQALSRMPAGLTVRAYVIGGPIYQTGGSQWTIQELRDEVSRLGLDGRVGFTGFLEDAAPAIRSLDIVVHASTQPEPFGMVIAEGMASGKPVIASQAGGAMELFVDGVNALAHAPADAAALSCQILKLVTDEETRNRLGIAGRATAERLYNRTRLAKEVSSVYERVSRCATELGNQKVSLLTAQVGQASLGRQRE